MQAVAGASGGDMPQNGRAGQGRIADEIQYLVTNELVLVAQPEVNHTDPGPGFPYDVVLGYAQELRNTRQPNNPTPTPTPETPEQGEERTMIRWVLDQLVGPTTDRKSVV